MEARKQFVDHAERILWRSPNYVDRQTHASNGLHAPLRVYSYDQVGGDEFVNAKKNTLINFPVGSEWAKGRLVDDKPNIVPYAHCLDNCVMPDASPPAGHRRPYATRRTTSSTRTTHGWCNAGAGSRPPATACWPCSRGRPCCAEGGMR